MSLAVKMFWVEDQERFFDLAASIFERVFREKLALEFSQPYRFGSYEEASAQIRSGLEGYDVALIDYRLDRGKAETGAALVEQLRKGEPPVYTEVIFYSGAPEEAKKDLIQRELGLSGVYLVGRGGGAQEFVEEKCLPVMQAIFAKILDLTRMRGILMAEVSDIEMELLARRVIALPEFQQVSGHDFMRVVMGKHATSNKNRAQALAKIVAPSGQSASDLLADNDIYANVVSQRVMLHFARKFMGPGEMKKVKKALGKVRNVRNELAHMPESKLHGKYGNPQRHFLKIRREILECRRVLEEAFPNPPVTPE